MFADQSIKNTPWSVMMIFDRTSNLGAYPCGIGAASLGIGYKF